MNVKTALLSIFSNLASHLATKYLNDKGMLLFTGAALPFREP
jgi:hypothetical protein